MGLKAVGGLVLYCGYEDCSAKSGTAHLTFPVTSVWTYRTSVLSIAL